MKIDESTVVTLAYQLHIMEGDTLHLMDQRDRHDPVEFVFGQGLLLSKVEDSLFQQTVGFKKEIVLSPADAYGEPVPELAQWVHKEKFPKDLELKIGMKFQTQGADGEILSAMIKEIKGDQVMLDGNHPLAGYVVHFNLEVLRVREAREDELASGTVQRKFH
jgi:FKBP-type peptidyl-prolyl cis-trans isomerase SlyD